jgi:5'(3')-deoxyribonucleotidase
MRKVIYIDMDGTIADFNSAVGREVKSVTEKCPESLEKGFYRNMKVITGAKQAVALLEEHFDVYIATKPKSGNPHCLEEKMEWVREHFPSLASKVFFTPNKNILQGHMLIDDHMRWSEFNGKFVKFDTIRTHWIQLAKQIISGEL